MEISRHYAHEIVVAQYSDLNGVAVNFSIECLDCDEVIADQDEPTN